MRIDGVADEMTMALLQLIDMDRFAKYSLPLI